MGKRTGDMWAGTTKKCVTFATRRMGHGVVVLLVLCVHGAQYTRRIIDGDATINPTEMLAATSTGTFTLVR